LNRSAACGDSLVKTAHFSFLNQRSLSKFKETEMSHDRQHNAFSNQVSRALPDDFGRRDGELRSKDLTSGVLSQPLGRDAADVEELIAIFMRRVAYIF
jgi:hypothetical protein